MYASKKTTIKFAWHLIAIMRTKIVNLVTIFDQFSSIAIKVVVGFLLAFNCFLTNNVVAATYQFVGPTTPYTWVPGTNVTQAFPAVAGALTDDSVSPVINIGFTFNYAGTNYTQLRIASNGMLFFNATAPTGTWYTNIAVASLPGAYSITNAMMPYWDDLDNNTATNSNVGVVGRIRYLTIGTAPNRQFVISFIGVPTYNSAGSSNTFQVILYENGRFQYNYQSTQLQGSSATVGYHVSATDLVQYSLDTANSAPNLRTLTWYISPSLTNLKSVSTISDPVNNTASPKNIPGAVVQYKIDVSNTSVGIVDADSTIITDPIPVNTELFTGGLSASAPFTFADGAPTSGLTCAFISLASTTDCIEFSNNAGATWTYTPSAATDYDAAVTNIRFKPTGTLNGDTVPAAAPYPNFNLTFKVRIK
jgi:hypothetical protein